MKHLLFFAGHSSGGRAERFKKMKHLNLMPILLLFALSFGFNQEAKANNTYVVGGATSNPKTYSSIKMKLGTKPQGWNDWQYKDMSKAGITFEGKALWITSYETSSDGNAGKLYNMQFQLLEGSTWKEEWNAIACGGTSDIHSNEIADYDNTSWYYKLTMGKSKIYFNATGWNQTTIKLVVGHANYQKYYQMTKIANTKLYYVNPEMSWSDAMGFGIVGGTSASDGDNWLTNVSAKAQEYTGFLHYGLNNNGDNVMYYVTNAGTTGQKPSCDYHANYTDLNKTQTIKVMVKKAGASTYTEETTVANWPATIKAKRYKLNSNGASSADETDADLTSATFTSVITSAAKIYVPTPSTGYTFKGWGTSSSSTPGNASSAYEYTVEDTKTIYLFFDENTYSVTAAAGTGCASVSPTGAQTVGQLTGKQFTATASTGYSFDNWTSNNGGTFSAQTATTTFKPTRDATITANFTENLTSVTISSNGNGSVSPDNASVGVATTQSVTATPDDGYHFASWAVTGNADIKSQTTANPVTLYGNGSGSTGTLKATFAETTYAITIEAGANGSVASNSVSVGQITSVALPKATPADGYNFKNWTATEGITITNANSADGATITATKTGIVTANFESAATYSLTVSTNPAAAFTTSSGSADNITLGQTYDISATLAEKGYTFTGWTADPAANAEFGNKDNLETTVTVKNGSVTVTANAQAKTTPLKLWANDGTENYVDATATYGQNIQVTVPTRTGYDFSGYYTQASSGSQFIKTDGTFAKNVNNWITNYTWSSESSDVKELHAHWTAQYWTKDISKNYQDAGASNGKYKATYDATSIEITTQLAPRAGYTLKGYAISNVGAKVAEVDGTLIANVDGWTNSEGKWINDNPGTIYAIWEEVLTTVALSANPVGSGTIKISGANATEAAVGITTRPAVSATPLNADWTFASWTPTNCSVVDGKLVGDGTSETGSLVANFTLTQCKLRWSITSSDFWNPDADEIMSYDTNERAYYYDITTTGSPLYFRFMIGTTEYSVDWLNGKYEDGRIEVTVGGTKVACDKEVQSWDKRATAKFTGATGSIIRIWFDQINKKTWITEPTHTVTILGSEYGTITPTGARQVGQLQGLAISATVSNDSYGFYFSGWTADKAGITFADASAKSTTVYASEDGTVTPNYASRYALRGSLATSDDPHGMPGWDDDTQTFNFIKGQRTATYQATLERYTNYKLKVKDLGNEGKSYGASGTISENGNIKLGNNETAPTFTTTVAGTYIFTLDVTSGSTTPTISIAYPASVTATYSISATNATAAANAPTAVSETVTIASGTRVTKDNSITFTAQPAKTGYTFSGWFDNAAGTGTALTTDLAYTTTANADITIYAVYAETMSTITINTPLSAQGSIDITGEQTLGISTSQQIVATAATGYYFKEWQVSGSALVTDAHSATTTVYTNGSGEIGNVTAVFEFRWVLRGSRVDSEDTEGMPGWETTTDYFVFEANAEQGTKTVTLEPNRQYKFMVYDKKLKKQCGYSEVTHLAASDWSKLLINENAFHLTMWSSGHGVYTFKVEENADHSKAKVYISNPEAQSITMGTLSVTEGCGTELDGGTIMAKDDENYAITTGQYVRKGGAVTFTATPKTGYTFSGFFSDAECTQSLSNDNPYTMSDIRSNKTVYAKFSERLYNVTYNNGETTTTIKAGVASHHPITAVQKDGKKFTGWETYGVSVANSTAKTTTISYVDMGVNDHRVTATYGDLDVIYFNNLSGSWNPSNMYVYFYKGAYPDFDAAGTGSQWDGGNTWAPTCMMNKGIPMTKIEGTNIWKAEYDKEDSEYFAYSSEDIKMVAFIDHEENLCDRFYACSLVYTEFYSCMNMFVLPDNSSFLKNTNACYYNKDGKGFWKNYETDNSGLFVNIYGGGSDRLSSTPMDQSEGEGWFSASVHLEPQGSSGEYDYYFIIGGCDGSNWSHKEGVVSKDANTITLHPYYKGENVYGEKVTIKTTAPGSYKFMVKHNDNNELDLKVEYPFNVNDYRVVSVVNGKAHDNGYIYKYSSTEKDDLASFFVKEGMTVKLQKCTAIAGLAVTWSDVAGQSISNFTANGYRNFTIHQDGNGSATLTAAGEYKGKFYLRTDVAPGGWSNYLTNAGNIMQENEYGTNDAQSFKFTHAYTNHVGHGGNVKFVIANDYSKCISDTLVKDNFITDNAGNLPSGKDANVRFMWNKNDNTVARAYIGGSANVSDRYLILLGNKNGDKSLMVDENKQPFNITGLNPDEAIFTDLGNWIYQVNIKAFSGAAVKLMADFNGHTQYFVGAAEGENAWRTIMAGSETENPYTIQVVYDFKSNRLVAGFVPDGKEISSDIVLNGDLLILREMQEDAKQIKFGEAAQGQNPYSISQIDHIYCGLQINKGTAQDGKGMIGSSNSDYAKTMYWISFPFDVNINEIFGLDGYGQKWIIQKYNGQKRADIGWFKGDGTETFWEFMDYNETMKAYEGYLFLLDANYFNETNDKVWEIGTVDHITFYFPSASGEIGIINKSSYPQSVPDHECKIDREFEVQGVGTVNHKITDSHWNVIGVPAFQNKTMALSNVNVDTDMKAIYQWNSTYNTYDVKALQEDFEFKTMYAYMVQYTGTINWSDVSVVSKPTTAPYRYTDEKNYMIELFFNGNDAEDHTYINLADEASTDFVLNEDMMKIDNAGYPNIYSFAGNYNVAYNETKKDNQTIMLGVSAPKDGNYTFAMPKDFSGTAKLVDLVEGITTDLNVANYSVDLNKGTYNNRFQLVLEVEAKTPTSIEADGQRGREADGKTTKLLRNGNIYLINGGRVYNATGAELQ